MMSPNHCESQTLTAVCAGRLNLPKKNKMDKPRYQDIQADKVKVVEEEGLRVRVLAGTHKGVTGPIEMVHTPGLILDVAIKPGATFSAEVQPPTQQKQAKQSGALYASDFDWQNLRKKP